MRGHAASIGTCGFSYPEWIEAGVYPAGTKSAHMLPLYSAIFQIVELNYTWYQMARAEPLARMASRVPPSFRFTAKLTRTMTHEIGDEWQKQARLYCQGVEPLLKSGNLLAVLAQFPPSFTRTRANRLYLAKLFDLLHSLPLAVEFRHRSWAHDCVFQGLEQRKITLVTVDAPPLPALFPALRSVPIRIFFIFVSMGVMEGDGIPAICSSSLTTVTLTESLIVSSKILSFLSSRLPARGLFFSITM